MISAQMPKNPILWRTPQQCFAATAASFPWKIPSSELSP